MKNLLIATSIIFKLSATTLIVGGGPAGLATAIEAAQQGDEVVVLEMRPSYIRQQSLFLTAESLDRLESWGVDLPELGIAEIGPDQRMGFVAIHHLEKQLSARAKALGVKIKQAKFVDFGDQEVIAKVDGEEIRFSYDILVGADGAHSQVREKLGIGLKSEGRENGISAITPLPDVAREIDISPSLKTEWGFVRRIATPGMSIVFMQSKGPITSKEMAKAADACNWHEEAAVLRTDQSYLIDNIEVLLQQANSFSDPNRRAILVGDAAATASFFEGMGVNTSLATAEIAGTHMKQLKQGDYSAFNAKMQETTDALLEDSRYLFAPENYLQEPTFSTIPNQKF